MLSGRTAVAWTILIGAGLLENRVGRRAKICRWVHALLARSNPADDGDPFGFEKKPKYKQSMKKTK
jgi:hypothetical protein